MLTFTRAVSWPADSLAPAGGCLGSNLRRFGVDVIDTALVHLPLNGA